MSDSNKCSNPSRATMVFDYEKELLRVEAPIGDVTGWLNRRAVEEATKKAGGSWAVIKSRFVKSPENGRRYVVMMERRDGP
jgi:hypothetical protein